MDREPQLSREDMFRLVPSGKQIFDRMGRPRQPMAEIATCECGFEHAAFGEKIDGIRKAYCGYRDGQLQCVGKGYGKEGK